MITHTQTYIHTHKHTPKHKRTGHWNMKMKLCISNTNIHIKYTNL